MRGNRAPREVFPLDDPKRQGLFLVSDERIAAARTRGKLGTARVGCARSSLGGALCRPPGGAAVVEGS